MRMNEKKPRVIVPSATLVPEELQNLGKLGSIQDFL